MTAPVILPFRPAPQRPGNQRLAVGSLAESDAVVRRMTRLVFAGVITAADLAHVIARQAERLRGDPSPTSGGAALRA